MKRILLALCCLISGISLFAYTHIPADSAVVKGVLPNGLTYYIRHNDYIPNRAAFHIAQKVGSIQETPEQRGLAHFLEHMAFNGTKHYPDKELINYLETIGVKFGRNLNARTGVDETVYMITDVPTERATIVDSCLLVLRDWCDGILLESEAIDQERGVIEEEWRSFDYPFERMLNKSGNVIYGEDKYSDCSPIGHIDVIRNFSHHEIRDYYKTWYRPDLQGIVIVGDIDVKRTEETIKLLFSDVKVPEGAPERIYYSVSDYNEPRILLTSDPEMTVSITLMNQKIESLPDSLKDTEESYRQNFICSLVTDMFRGRLKDITKEQRPPFAEPWLSSYGFLNSQRQKSFSIQVINSTDGPEVAFKRMMAEVERMRRFGFTEGELERAKKTYIADVEQMYNQRNQLENAYYVYQYINNFLEGESMATLDTYYELAKNMSENTTLADINEWINSWNTNNKLIWCFGADLKDIPTEEFIKKELEELPNIELTPYEDVTIPDEIIPDSMAPKVGKILRKKSLKNGIVEYKLSNGVEVYFKHTDFKDDEILLSARSHGGMSMVETADLINARLASELYQIGGIGTMNKIQLDKFLSDKYASLWTNIDKYAELIYGEASKKDVDYLFQLLYANFTTLREDSLAFLSYKQRYTTLCKNLDKDPFLLVNDSMINLAYANNKMVKNIKVEDLDQLDYSRSLQIYRERFSNAADFKFTIVGSIDEKTLEPLLEKYVASLPASKSKEKVKRGEPISTVGTKSLRYKKGMQEPATTVCMYNFVKVKSNVNELSYSMLKEVLDVVYIEKVREEQGGTYGVGTYVGVNKYPTNYVELKVSFTTDSTKVDTLLPIIYTEFAKVAKEGPSDECLKTIKEYRKKTFIDNQKDNYYWVDRLQDIQLYGKDAGATYLKRLDKVSAKDIQKAAETLLNSNNQKEVIQLGVAIE